MSDSEHKGRCIYWGGDVRSIADWRFEDGGFIKIVATDNVSTDKAIEWIERLLQVKKDELANLRTAGEG